MQKKMKTNIYSLANTKQEAIDLPIQFLEPVRKDLIKRAVLAMQSHRYQPYGTDPRAGTRQGRTTSKRRRKFSTVYGTGSSRVRRKAMWRRGSQFGWVGAFIANAVKGRAAFPPNAEKVIKEKINKKERKKAIRSAIAASEFKIVEDKLESIAKTKEFLNALIRLGYEKDLGSRKIRAGKGKMRGRKYKTRKAPLVVVSKDCPTIKAGRNLLGLDIVEVQNLNAELLAPGTLPGRKAIWTKSAVDRLEKERLFI